ncbi:uncharacterized protein LOC18013696 isoform X2 [Eutrema salsugineum]|uniref:uncharacterized protein LOC18013696 isoform X2 n=1 Tax=Eutrema salsugineum TaxID=72664 RepID=UPI000CECF686|nr:uncharacterized protein LOC18013696 isoform X2 [Eutrema salsugineum]
MSGLEDIKNETVDLNRGIADLLASADLFIGASTFFLLVNCSSKRARPQLQGEKTKTESPPNRVEIEPLEHCDTNKRQPLKVVWDAQNCFIPTRLSYNKAYDNIVRTRREWNYEVDTFCAYSVKFCDKFKQIPGVEPVPVPVTLGPKGEKRDDVDNAIELNMSQWVIERVPPAPVLLIAGDADYIEIIEKLIGCGFKVILAYNSNAIEELRNSTPESVSWDELVGGKLINKNLPSPVPQDVPSAPMRCFIHSPTRSMRVIWDLRTCALPGKIEMKELRMNIEKAVEEAGDYRVQSIQVYSTHLKPGKIKKLEGAGIQVQILHPPTHGKKKRGKGKKKGRNNSKEHCDARIAKEILDWSMIKEPPAPILLISGDVRLRESISVLVAWKYDIFLAHNNKCEDSLKNSSTRSGFWNRFHNGKSRGVAWGMWDDSRV